MKNFKYLIFTLICIFSSTLVFAENTVMDYDGNAIT
jgi:hypothetical protein